ncbi:MAG: hypothetical protein WBL63_25470, partial [Candidatus Acidiferrum sp.]
MKGFFFACGCNFSLVAASKVCGTNWYQSKIQIHEESVGVGIMMTHNPLHGSGQADFPHPALALGD